ncbi:MAG: sensor histidine kinase [Bacteroidota bacterium]
MKKLDEASRSSSPSRIAIHVILWLLVLQLIFDLSGLYYSLRSLVESEEYLIDEAFLLIPFFVLLFYTNSQFLIPRFLSKKSWWKYLIGILLSFAIIVCLNLSIFTWLESLGFRFLIEKDEFWDAAVMMNILVVFASTSVGVTKMAWTNSEQKKLAEEKQKEVERKFLMNQFNPHFLFNTLNAIYALSTEEGAEKTTEAVLRLSEIMRLSVHNSGKYRIPLKEELDFIKHYIDLQTLRLGEDYPIHFGIHGDPGHREISPLMFIPLVENAFKYGVSLRDPKLISIEISIQEVLIHFHGVNEINQAENIPSYGLGIDNLRSRLELEYKDDYSLSAKEEENRYVVELKILDTIR